MSEESEDQEKKIKNESEEQKRFRIETFEVDI